jgi:hypothetical protein
MLDDFKRALARVQSDFGFYIDCQANPIVALAGYDLSQDERSALIDPEKLADVLKGGIDVNKLPRITITISGRHDWINRPLPPTVPRENTGSDARIASEVDAIRRASTREERTDAVVRLMELIG